MRTLKPASLLAVAAAAVACGTADPSGEGGESGESGESGADSGGDTDGMQTVDACDGATQLERDPDPAARGPWAVGARESAIGDVTFEVWYPAAPGSEDGVAAKRYDTEAYLPPSQQGVIPEADRPVQECDCHADLPLDTARGPYPVVLFIHGTAGFRTQSLTQMTHWASRGFVVVAADYPGLKLAHMLAFFCPDDGGTQDLSGDTDAVLTALAAAEGDLAFLDGHLQLDRVAIAGHSAGGSAAANSTGKQGVRVVIPMASGAAASAAGTLEVSLHLAGNSDAVVSYSSSVSAYEASAAPKHFVGLENAGHLAFSDLCSIQNAEGQNIVEIGEEHGVCGVALGGALFDCDPTYLPDPDGWAIINYATTAVLEDVLQCRADGVDLAAIGSVYADVAEYRGE